MDAKDRNAIYLPSTRHTLSLLDASYTSFGTLGTGAFGTVFLAQKRSGRKVALKVMPLDTSDDEEYETFTRELESVVELNCSGDDGGGKGDRDLHIVYFEDWFISRNFVCIVMQYANGGTLAQEIERKSECSPPEPYAERRIAWYALQLCDALAFAHEKGVAHHDVKPANILIDASAGGKLLLADFGTALKPGEETVGFTKSYASPELLASYELEDFADLRPDKIDAFALGAVLYELLACRRLEQLSTEQTLAQFITDGPGLEAAMTIHHMVLPWLPPDQTGAPSYVGYTHELKNLVMNFLRPNSNERFLPGQVQNALRSEASSPLLLSNVPAAQTAVPGAPITIDNVQLGQLVQRGPDWSDGDQDGGVQSVGVVVKLDGDGTYCWAAFPTRTNKTQVESNCYRMGANDKYELQVGPIPLMDYVTGSSAARNDGIVHVGEPAANISVGLMLDRNCMVVGVDVPRGIAFAAPMELRHAPPVPKRPIWQTDESSLGMRHREESCPPSTWELNLGPFVNVLNTEEGNDVLDLLYNKSGGLRKRGCPVESVQRVQDKWLWDTYTRGRQKASEENWGIENEIRAFSVSPEELNKSNLQNFQCKQFSTKASTIHYKFNRRSTNNDNANAKSQILLCRVVLGRVGKEAAKCPFGLAQPPSAMAISALTKHSEEIGKDLFAVAPYLAYPEYLITYQDNSTPPAVNSPAAEPPSGRSETKMCIICMERPVRYLTIPCGHACLCERCNHPTIRQKLKGKCPECRSRYTTTAIIYGRVVNDE